MSDLLDRAFYNASEYGRYVDDAQYYELMRIAQYRLAESQKAWNAFANARYLRKDKNWDPFQYVRGRDISREEAYANMGSVTLISGGCFITSACIAHMREVFDDNCYELTLLRKYRDTYLKKHHPEDIKTDYRIAPGLVEKIDALPDCKEIYMKVYKDMVVPSVRAIENSEYEKAYEIYSEGCYVLNDKYGGKNGYQYV